MMDANERVAFITRAAKAKVEEARKALERTEKELDLTYRSAYNIPKRAVALAGWYNYTDIVMLQKGGLPPLIVSDDKNPLAEEWGDSIKTPIRVGGIWQ